MRGTSTLVADISQAEITHISKHGFWMLLDNEELHLPFEQFPWFKSATIDEICAVERVSEKHLFWETLDIDLSIDSIKNPAEFPLISAK